MKPAPSVIGIIPARYSSSRFPGKMLAMIAGKTLLQRTYENAAQCPLLDALIVATDDERILHHVQSFGGKAVMTSVDCASGTDRIAEALARYPELSGELIINIQGDEPCLNPLTIAGVISTLKNNLHAPMATACTPLKNPEDALLPSIVKCTFDAQGYALYFSRSPIPFYQQCPKSPKPAYYRHLGIYGYRREFLPIYTSLPATPLQKAEDLEQLRALEHGYRIRVVVVQEDSTGVDLPDDVVKIEQLIKQIQATEVHTSCHIQNISL